MKKLVLIHAVTEKHKTIDYDPTCSDKFVHVRFSFFNDSYLNEDVYGFDQKISFIMTFLASKFVDKIKDNQEQQMFLNSISSNKNKQNYIFDSVLMSLGDTNEFKTINNLIAHTFVKSDGVHLYKAVGKLASKNIYNVCGKCQGLDEVETLDQLLNLMGISLTKFLFDDTYGLKYVDVPDVNKEYKKYYAKQVRKKLSKSNINSKEIELW